MKIGEKVIIWSERLNRMEKCAFSLLYEKSPIQILDMLILEKFCITDQKIAAGQWGHLLIWPIEDRT